MITALEFFSLFFADLVFVGFGIVLFCLLVWFFDWLLERRRK